MGVYPNYTKIRGIEFSDVNEQNIYKHCSNADFTKEEIKKAVDFYGSLSDNERRYTVIRVLVEVSCTYELASEPKYMWIGLPDISFIAGKTI